MSGDRPPWMFDPNRNTTNGFFIRPEQQQRYYFRPDHTQESARLEKSGPKRINWPALVAGVAMAMVLTVLIIVIAIVVTRPNDVSATTLSPNTTVAQSVGLSIPTTTRTTARTSSSTIAQLLAGDPNPNPSVVQLPFSNSTIFGSTGGTTSSTLFSPAVCSDNTWIKLSDGYPSNWQYQSGITSPVACQSACLALSECLGIMWYTLSVEGCYFVFYSSSFSTVGSNYVYYSLIRNQSNCDANDTCIYAWIGQSNRQVIGAVRNPNLYTLNSCIASCQNNPNCSAVDWDLNQYYCWHFLNTNESSRTQLGPGIYHFDKDCRDPYVTTTALPAPTAPSNCPNGAVMYCEPTGQCLYYYNICDKFQDCPNDIDETNCTCDANHYQCKNGRCIYRSWLCDGVEDCPLKDDESPPQCSTCSPSQFLCGKTHTCISMSQRCDGVADCSGSEDEVNCLKLSGNGTGTGGNNFTTHVVNATYRGIADYYICSDNWNESLSDSVCQNMGYRKSLTTSFVNVSGTASFLALNLSISSANLLAHLQTSPCILNKAVAVSCADSECGTRGNVPPDSVGPYIINGQRARRGAWPWQVLYEIGTYYCSDSSSCFSWYSSCGAVILNDRWLLTAGHCTQAPDGFGYSGQVRPANVRISLGSLSRWGDNDTVYARVDQVYTHPSYATYPVTDNDVGLLRLSEPLTFTDTIRPICLPTPTEDLSTFRVCVDTGFGQTNKAVSSDYLLQARMNIIPYNNCYYYINYFLRGQTQICIGTLPTEYDNNVCFGDSGGPFACEDYTGVWKVIGINSYVIGGGLVPSCSRSIVARVTAYVDWIQQTMAANSV